MKATEANLLKFLRKSPQFVYTYLYSEITLGKRMSVANYGRISCVQAKININGHFIGSIVYVERALSSVTIQEALLVIDGQQRLTNSC